MGSSLRSGLWLCTAFSLGLSSVIALSYQMPASGSREIAGNSATVVHLPEQNGLGMEAEQEVRSAVDGFRLAMLLAKPDQIIASSAPDLSFGHSSGEVQTREQFADSLRRGVEVFKRVDLSNRKLRVVGDTAIERHHFSADIIYKGRLTSFELEIVEVWKKTDKWRLLVRQAYKA